jgi:quinol monooxygenase YgiN
VSGEENSMSQVTNLAALVEPRQLEAGCLNYDLHLSVDDADVWFVYENWRSPEGFKSSFCAT